MDRYFYTLNADGTIKCLTKGKALKNGTEISEEDYKKYISLIESVPHKVGYETIVHLYPDFTLRFEYKPIDIADTEEVAEDDYIDDTTALAEIMGVLYDTE